MCRYEHHGDSGKQENKLFGHCAAQEGIRNNWEWKEREGADQQQAHLEIIGRTAGVAKRDSEKSRG